jgi:hypothetical protein
MKETRKVSEKRKDKKDPEKKERKFDKKKLIELSENREKLIE